VGTKLDVGLLDASGGLLIIGGRVLLLVGAFRALRSVLITVRITVASDRVHGDVAVFAVGGGGGPAIHGSITPDPLGSFLVALREDAVKKCVLGRVDKAVDGLDVLLGLKEGRH